MRFDSMKRNKLLVIVIPYNCTNRYNFPKESCRFTRMGIVIDDILRVILYSK